MEENEVVEEVVTEGTQEVSNEAGGSEVPEIKDPRAVLEALERAKTDAKTHREAAEAKDAELVRLNERIAALESDETVNTWKGKVLELHTKSALAKAGVKEVDRIHGLLGGEGLSLDDEGNLQGFDEAFKELKTRLPELFDDKRRVARSADAFATGDIKPEVSTTDAQLARLRAGR